MTEASSYAMPAIDSVWEWDTGNPWGRRVVTVKQTASAAIQLTGPSGDYWVSLPDFADNAVPAALRRHR